MHDDTIQRAPGTRITPVTRLLAARALRAFADGYVSLLLPLYLIEIGYSAFEVGILATTTLAGSGLATLLVGTLARHHRYRTLLVAASVLMAATGLAFAGTTTWWLLVAIAALGTLNPSSGDVTVFVPLEHAMLSRLVGDAQRTDAFARYSLTGALAGACGALAAALPAVVAEPAGGVPLRAAMQAMFVLYAAIAGAAACIYLGLPRAPTGAERAPAASLTASRRKVFALAALFSLDAFGGGFVVQSLLALWLYERFALSAAATGTLFFWTGVLTAFSYLVAARLAKRWGLINTMVFTHLPSSLCLIAIPFMPSLALVIALLFVRSALSQMDVPTRSSYVMAIVTPPERPAAASITSVPRSLAAAISPLFAGYLIGVSSFGWPLLIGGAVKIVYDVALLAAFRRIRPPEESERTG